MESGFHTDDGESKTMVAATYSSDGFCSGGGDPQPFIPEECKVRSASQPSFDTCGDVCSEDREPADLSDWSRHCHAVRDSYREVSCGRSIDECRRQGRSDGFRR